MGPYSALIQADTGCTPEDVRKIEIVMRDFVVGHPLDGLSRLVFRSKAREAYALLMEEGAMFEAHFTGVRMATASRSAGDK